LLLRMKKSLYWLIFLAFLVFSSGLAQAQETPLFIPRITIEPQTAEQPEQFVFALQVLIFLTVLSLAPAILILLTSFTRIVVVLAFVRNALGSPQIPPTPVLIGLALFLTYFVMAPTFSQLNQEVLTPFMDGSITQSEAFSKGEAILRDFMFRQTQEKDLALMVSLAKIPRPRNRDEVPTYVLIPAFVLSELKIAFTLGFIIYVPFLLIDMVVASILMSMGMMMLPPVMISLPFKILLFVLVDGWELITRGLVLSVR